jgi:hypothetical protein
MPRHCSIPSSVAIFGTRRLWLQAGQKAFWLSAGTDQLQMSFTSLAQNRTCLSGWATSCQFGSPAGASASMERRSGTKARRWPQETQKRLSKWTGWPQEAQEKSFIHETLAVDELGEGEYKRQR